MQNHWQLKDAKKRFSELVERALKEGPQVVRHQGRMVVIVSYEAYWRLTHPASNLADFLLNSPLAGAELDLARDRELTPGLDLVV